MAIGIISSTARPLLVPASRGPIPPTYTDGRRYTSADLLRATPSSSFSLFLARSRQALANLAAIPASQYLAERHRFFNLGFTAILKKVAAASRSLHGTGTEGGACVRNPKNRHFFLLQLSIKSARRQTPKSESDKSPQLTAAAAPHLSMRQNG